MSIRLYGFFAMLALISVSTYGQQAPDSGRVLQETARPTPAPRPSQAIEIDRPEVKQQGGGVQVTLRKILIDGNTRFQEAELRASLGAYEGRTFDYSELSELANRVVSHYREAGYPFVYAYLPPQDVSLGHLKIQVIEGRYGDVTTQGEIPYAQSAEKFLYPLQRDAMIESGPLERVTLILSDQPGIKSTPIIRPGRTLGDGDLLVQVDRNKPWSGEAGIDNHGNRFTGRNRARFNAEFNSPFTLGDQISLKSLYTDQGMWFGSLGYGVPLGGSGLRGQIGYTHTYYELGKDFSNLAASGTADIFSTGLSYPLIRSQQSNLTLSATLQHKKLNDRQATTSINNDKSSIALPVSVNFDVRDSLGGGAISYGSVSWTHGNLRLDDSLSNTDRNTARTIGNFDHVNLDIVRLQSLPVGFSLSARLSGQLASKNLDSSEKFGLGGANGVRAYPSGEGYGDQGWLTQIELRYTIESITPFAFYDAGQVQSNKTPWSAGNNNRSLSGTGLGARFQQNGWKAEASVAWKTHGGNALSDSRQELPMLWANIQYVF